MSDLSMSYEKMSDFLTFIPWVHFTHKTEKFRS